MSCSRLQALIREGQLKINQLVIREPKTRLKTGDSIEVFLPEPVTARPEGEAIDREILYEDDDLIVINKPADLVIHPDNGNETGTMVNAVICSSVFFLPILASLKDLWLTRAFKACRIFIVSTGLSCVLSSRDFFKKINNNTLIATIAF